MRTFTKRDVDLLRTIAKREEERADYLLPHDKETARARVSQLRELVEEIDQQVHKPEIHFIALPEDKSNTVLSWRGITLQIITQSDGTLFVDHVGEDKTRSQWPQWLRAYEQQET
jgi:hypothetical protein